MGIFKILCNLKLVKITFVILLTILFLLEPGFYGVIDNSILLIYLALLFIAVSIHFLIQDDKNWFRLDVIFILGFIIVHFQWVIMLAVSDVVPIHISRSLVDTNYINYGTWLSTVGIMAWFVGYSMFNAKPKNIVYYHLDYKRLLWLTVFLFILFVLTSGSEFLSGSMYKGGRGTGEGLSVYFQLVLAISILVLSVVIMLNNKISYNSNTGRWILGLDKKYIILVAMYSLLFLSVGDRGSVIQIVLLLLVVFGSIIRPISLKKFVAIILVGAIFVALIGLGRSVDSDENILVSGVSKFQITSNYDITLELANSVNTLYLALSDVPNHRDYFWGKLWLADFLSIIPLSQRFYILLSDDEVRELGSSSYITYLRYGLHPTSGAGSSLIADIYLNFGSIGVVMFMFMLGLFFKKSQNELNLQRNFSWIITAAMLASISLYMSRSGVFDGLKAIVWGVLLAKYFVIKKRLPNDSCHPHTNKR